MFWKHFSIVIVIAAVGPGGCGPTGPVMVPVSGTVTMDGEPMGDGTIYFKTIEEGSVDRMDVKDGRFQGMVEVGERRVEISRLREGEPFQMAGGEIPNMIDTIPARYNRQSELTANVTEEGPNEFPFEVKSK